MDGDQEFVPIDQSCTIPQLLDDVIDLSSVLLHRCDAVAEIGEALLDPREVGVERLGIPPEEVHIPGAFVIAAHLLRSGAWLLAGSEQLPGGSGDLLFLKWCSSSCGSSRRGSSIMRTGSAYQERQDLMCAWSCSEGGNAAARPHKFKSIASIDIK